MYILKTSAIDRAIFSMQDALTGMDDSVCFILEELGIDIFSTTRKIVSNL